MFTKSHEKKAPTGCYNSHSNPRRKRKELVAGNNPNSNGPSSASHNKHNTNNWANRNDPGALILKLLQGGRSDAPVSSQPSNCTRPQSRAKQCDSVGRHPKTWSEESASACTDSSRTTNAVNLFETPPSNRKGRYSVNSSYGTNNPKAASYSNSSGSKSLSSRSSNPANFALPMYMRSPNPESIPMPYGFSVG